MSKNQMIFWHKMGHIKANCHIRKVGYIYSRLKEELDKNDKKKERKKMKQKKKHQRKRELKVIYDRSKDIEFKIDKSKEE